MGSLRVRSVIAIVSLALVVAGCERERPPPASFDGAIAPRDGGPLRDGRVVFVDGGGRRDGGRDGSTDFDAGPLPDGGRPPIVIDGVVGDAEWAGVPVEETAVETAGPGFEASSLTSLRVTNDTEFLYLALETVVGPDAALLVYVDATHGIGFDPLPTGDYEDFSSPLNTALSKTFFVPPELSPDFAFGTLDMERGQEATDDRMGWRDVRDSTLFQRVGRESGVVRCSADACEARIRRSVLSPPAGAETAIFVRLGAASGPQLSNQTLPENAPAAPEDVGRFVTIPWP